MRGVGVPTRVPPDAPRAQDFFCFGTLAPFSRASLRPMAMACLRLVTFLPEPLRSVPRLRSCIAFFTFFCAVVRLRPDDFLDARLAVVLRPEDFFDARLAVLLRPADVRVPDLRAVDLRALDLCAVDVRPVDLPAVDFRLVELRVADLRADDFLRVLFLPSAMVGSSMDTASP